MPRHVRENKIENILERKIQIDRVNIIKVRIFSEYFQIDFYKHSFIFYVRAQGPGKMKKYGL